MDWWTKLEGGIPHLSLLHDQVADDLPERQALYRRYYQGSTYRVRRPSRQHCQDVERTRVSRLAAIIFSPAASYRFRGDDGSDRE